MAVRVRQRIRDLTRDPHRVGDGDLMLPPQPIGERLPIHIRHHVERHAIDLAGVEQWQDVGMLEVAGDLDLAGEAARPHDRCKVRLQYLDGDRAIELAVLREIHVGHPAASDRASDLVATGQRATELSKWGRHVTLARMKSLLRYGTVRRSARRTPTKSVWIRSVAPATPGTPALSSGLITPRALPPAPQRSSAGPWASSPAPSRSPPPRAPARRAARSAASARAPWRVAQSPPAASPL